MKCGELVFHSIKNIKNKTSSPFKKKKKEKNKPRVLKQRSRVDPAVRNTA